MVEGMNKAMQSRLNQARESLEEAKDLLMLDADVKFVMNSLYYAFLYALWGLLESQGISAPAHSTAISLFEREFVLTGKIEKRFHDALREAFDLRPACDCEGKRKVIVEDVERLLPIADKFLHTVGRFAG
ncbi:MAG TPA: HEPN domain-containing protein [Nitrospirota bacterium]|nr:HEPN domain-containing protein [Nitrospirota bacterium]